MPGLLQLASQQKIVRPFAVSYMQVYISISATQHTRAMLSPLQAIEQPLVLDRRKLVYRRVPCSVNICQYEVSHRVHVAMILSLAIDGMRLARG